MSAVSDRRRTLDELLDELPPGLLDEAKIAAEDRPPAGQGSRDAFFERINAFVDQHGREPSRTATPGSEERELGLNLHGVRRDAALREQLQSQDRHGLLDQEPENETPVPDDPPQDTPADPGGTESGGAPSLEAMLADESLLGLLDTDDEAGDVFDLVHVPPAETRTAPDEIAEREPCEDFDFFAPLFDRMRERVASGAATVEPFHRGGQVEVGDYFYLRGQMCLVDAIEATETRENGEAVYRVRVVFDNGTEMQPYKHSLGRALLGQKSRGYERGQRILDPDIVADRFNGITHRDQSQGFVYVLRSKRTDPIIQAQHELFKVGLTRRTIADRLQGAEHQTTYLEGPVELVAEWQIYGANLRRVERLLLMFLEPRRAQLTLTDSTGRQYRPREWFNVPFATIKTAAEAIIDGTLANYYLNPNTGEIRER